MIMSIKFETVAICCINKSEYSLRIFFNINLYSLILICNIIQCAHKIYYCGKCSNSFVSRSYAGSKKVTRDSR